MLQAREPAFKLAAARELAIGVAPKYLHACPPEVGNRKRSGNKPNGSGK